ADTARHLRSGAPGGGRRVMLARMRLVLAVAAWEFRRFYKLRDQLLSLALAIIGGAFSFAVQSFVGRASGPVHVAIVGGERLPPLIFPGPSRIDVHSFPVAAIAELREAVGRRELDGLLIIDSPERAELLVAKEPIWEHDLQTALNDARSRLKLKDTTINAKDLDALFAPMTV